MAKWITYKLADTLNKMGIINYYISNSGGKGYHVEIFIDDLIPVTTAQRFYNLVINKAEVFGYDGEVEFRPTNKQGVKLPLGINQKYFRIGGYCSFCNIEDGLKEKTEKENYEYFLNIRKIKREVINDILNIEEDSLEHKNLKKKIQETEEVITEHNELPIYNPTEEYSLDKINDIYVNGLKTTGSRHNACFNIAKFLKYHGCNKEETEKHLIDWMKEQDKRYYTTPLNEALEDIKEIVEYVYSHDLYITPQKEEIEVSFNEINEIIIKCPKKNQKLLLYSMLIHSKRFATKSGIFYMTYKQMSEATGLVRDTLIKQVNKLEKLGVIEVVERNGKNYEFNRELNIPVSKPNKYKITLDVEGAGNIKHINYNNIDTVDDFKDCLGKYYTKSEIKKLLSRREYEYFS
ncbi:MAG: helix-turn-helix domain-containing protein [Methanobacteriaceae archaeon]|nr:helix-turn-helix domain-containing protein [Methanobacteriaceae archaeon]